MCASGFDGYKAIHDKTHKVALYLAKEIEKKKPILFEMINDGAQLRSSATSLKDDSKRDMDVYDLADRLLMTRLASSSLSITSQFRQTKSSNDVVIRADLV